MRTRDELHRLASSLLDVCVARSPGDVPRGKSFRYTENGEALELGRGLWHTVTSDTFRWIIADPETQQVFVFAALSEGSAPVLAAFRGRADAQGWTELEALVSRKGQSSIFAPERLTSLDPLYDAIVPEGLCIDRNALRAAAEGYFDGIQYDDVTRVRFDESCRRFENGALTTSNPEFLRGMGCREQFEKKLFAYIKEVRARRYPVFDVERGLACACVFLDVPGTQTHFEFNGRRHELPPHMRVARSVYLFEVFKVVDGNIREIQALMVNLPYLAGSGWE